MGPLPGRVATGFHSQVPPGPQTPFHTPALGRQSISLSHIPPPSFLYGSLVPLPAIWGPLWIDGAWKQEKMAVFVL